MSELPQPPSLHQPDLDPKPQAPEPPDINDCCGNGCEPCIFDRHDMAMDDYRQALRAWQARQGQAPGQGG
jgi:hypothetical protein